MSKPYQIKLFWNECPSCPTDDECQGHFIGEGVQVSVPYSYEEARTELQQCRSMGTVKQAQIVLHEQEVVAQWRRFPDDIEETLWCKGSLTFADSDLLSATRRRHVAYTLFVEREMAVDLKSFRRYYDTKRGMEVLTFLYDERNKEGIVDHMCSVQSWNLASEAFADGLTHPDWKDQLILGERIV